MSIGHNIVNLHLINWIWTHIASCNFSQVGWWEVGSEGGEGEGVSRTSHSAAVQGDSMWVVGGEFLHRAPPGSMVRIWLSSCKDKMSTFSVFR